MRVIEITENTINKTKTYGLKISENETAISFPEICDNKERIEILKVRLENEDVSITHIQDIVRDFITESTCDILIANSLLQKHQAVSNDSL